MIDTSGDAFRAMHHSSHRDARESISPNDRLVLLTSLSYEEQVRKLETGVSPGMVERPLDTVAVKAAVSWSLTTF